MLQLSLDAVDDLRTQAEVDDAGREIVRYTLGVKQDVGTAVAGLARTEVETVVDEQFFAACWEASRTWRLRKIRVELFAEFAFGGPRVVVVDMFRDRLEGLVIAELEFDSWIESKEFPLPDVLGVEVTHDRRYRNASLANADSIPA
jgi:hypothetical protein